MTTTLGRHEAAIDGNRCPVNDRWSKKNLGGKRNGADVDLDQTRAYVQTNKEWKPEADEKKDERRIRQNRK
jgi:hypothetical protein